MLSQIPAASINNRSKHLAALLMMLMGPILVFGMVIVMNRMQVNRDQKTFQEVSRIAMVKNELPKQNAAIKKAADKPKPKTSRPMKSSVAIPQLNAGASGLDFGMALGGLDSGATSNQSTAGDNLLNKQNSANDDQTADTLPQPKVKSPFAYPKAAKSKGVEGYVVLSVLVDETGTVEKADVLESSPEGVFDESALAGINNWRFSPGLKHGKAVSVWVKQKIRFSLG